MVHSSAKYVSNPAQDDIWTFDGGHDVHKAFALSNEPISDQIARTYGREPSAEKTASHIAATNVAKRAYQKEYMEYWNSTSRLTGTDEPVVALIAPVAPFAAARPGKYDYYGNLPMIDLRKVRTFGTDHAQVIPHSQTCWTTLL